MKKRYITLFLALIISSLSFAQNINAIEPELQKVLNQKNEELIEIHIYFKSNINSEQLRQKSRTILDATTKKNILIEELKAHASDVQNDVVNILEAEKLNGKVSDIRCLWLSNSISCKASRDMIYELSSHPDIKMIGYDREIQIISPQQMEEGLNVKSQPLRGPAAHVVTVNADHVWEQGYTGKNVIVAVLDSGTNPKHKDLADHLWKGYVDTNNDGSPDKYVNGWNFIANNSDITDDFGHGTHCAGIVCGDGTSGTTAGVAPDASLMTVKTVNRAGGGSVSQMLNGVQFAVENGANVLSMSLGFKNHQLTTTQKEEIRETFEKLLDLGVVVCAAVGNDGNNYGAPDNVDYPAACPAPWLNPDQTLKGGISSVIAIGADDLKESSQGPSTWEGTSYNDYAYNEGESMGLIRPDISAPGNMIYSLNYLYVDKYQLKSGTSQATPCVAGIVALMLEKNPSLTPAEISQILEETAANKPATKNNTVGAGRADALAAVNAVKESEGTPFLKLVSFTPSTVGNASTTISITIKNEGKGASDANTTATLSIQNDPYITIANPSQTINRIGANNTQMVYYDININENVPSGHIANFSLTTTSGNNKWEDLFSIKVSNTPDVVIKTITPSSIQRNGTTEIGVTMINNGNAPLTDPMSLKLSTIAFDSKYLTIVDDTDTIKALGVGEMATGTFTLTTNENTPDGYKFDLFIETFSRSNAPGNYTYGFEENLDGWTCFNASRNANIKKPWWHSSEALLHDKDARDSHTGYGHIMSETSPNKTSEYTYPIDNYLVSPKIKATENSKISFYARSGNEAYYAEHFGLAISTSGNTSANDFSMIQEWVITDRTKWKEYTVDLSDYADQEIYVAIRHFFTDQEWEDNWHGYDVETLNIDDVMLSDVLINTYFIPTLSYDDITYFNATACTGIINMPKIENVTATADSISTINLNWDAVNNATSYNIYRYGEKIANVQGTSYIDKELTANTKYCYNITSVNGNSESVFSDEIYVTTLSVEGNSIPEAPVVTAEATSDTTIVLTWNKIENAAVYVVYQDTMTLTSELTDTTFIVSGLEGNTEYCFNVTAVNEIGESEKSADACATTEKSEEKPVISKPDAPVVTAEALSTSEISLTWNAVDGATSYNVYKNAFAIAKGLTGTKLIVKDLEYNTEYCFTVTAVNEAGESKRSEKACATTLGENIEELSSSVCIYPNPVENILVIETNISVEEISIYTITGMIINNLQNVGNNTERIDVSGLNSGIYFIKIKNNDNEIIKRFIKK